MQSKLAALALVVAAVAWTTFSAAQPAKPAAFKSTDARAAVRDFEAGQKQVNSEYDKVQTANAARYKTKVLQLKTALIERLKSAQGTATQDADLDEALKLRDEIKRLEETPVTAPDGAVSTSCRVALARLRGENDRLNAELAKNRNDLGAVTGAWGTTGTQFQLEVAKDGPIVMRVKGRMIPKKLVQKDGRVFGLAESDEHLELIPLADGLVVLGWTVGKRHPFETQPNHAGLLKRIN